VNSCPKEKPPGSPRPFSTVPYPQTCSLRAKQDRPCPFPFSIPPPSFLALFQSSLRQSKSGSYTYFLTYLTKGNALCFVSGFMDWIQSAKLIPFYYVVTLWLPANASKGDPLEFPAVSVIEVAFRHPTKRKKSLSSSEPLLVSFSKVKLQKTRD